MQILTNILKKQAVITFLVFLAAGTSAGFWYRNYSRVPIETVRVQRGAISEDVLATGTTRPLQRVDLAFERAGKVDRITVDVGVSVRSGQILAELSSGDLAAQIAEYEALKKVEEVKLDELKRGTRAEEIAIQEVKVANAIVSLDDAKRNLADKIDDSYTKADDAVYGKSDQFFTNPRTRAELALPYTDSQLKLDIETRRSNLEESLKEWASSLIDLRNSLDQTAVKRNLEEVRTFLDKLSFVVSALTPTSNLTQTTLDSYKADVSAARTNINTALGNLSTAEEKLRSAESALKLTQNELALKKAGATSQEIAAQEARIEQATAKIAATLATITKGVIRAPLAGVITKRDIDQGEVVAANAAVLSMISEKGLEIEVFVPEINIGSISLGDPVAITFDAFPGEPFTGKVSFIDPAETVRDGIVNFRVEIVFEADNPRLKSGLTANLRIRIFTKENVLWLPPYALMETPEGAFVEKLVQGEQKRFTVTIGARSRDGKVEILSGVSEGEEVLNVGAEAR